MDLESLFGLEQTEHNYKHYIYCQQAHISLEN